jgi:ATP-binding cassette, subfamily B, bacterial
MFTKPGATNGGSEAAGSIGQPPGESTLPNTRSLKERVGALKNLHPFIAMVWQTSPYLTAASLALRLVRALLPVATLFVGKLIIDDMAVARRGSLEMSCRA